MMRFLLTMVALGGEIWAQVQTQSSGQGLACPARQVLSSVLVDVRTDTGGEPVKDLTAADLRVVGKGVTAEPVGVVSDVPLDMLILIEPHNRKDRMDGAVPLLMTALDAEDRVMVWHYGTGVDRKTDWESDFGKVRDALLDAGRGIQLQTVRPLNAVVEALRAFPEPAGQERKRVILLIGDEQDWSTPVRWEAVLANLKEKRVMLSVMADGPRGRVMGKVLPKINVTPGNVGDVRPGESQGRFGVQSVGRLAEAAGGDALAPNGIWYLEEIVQRLKERYLVTYCVERGRLKKVPAVELTERVKQENARVSVKVPGAVR